ncbi:succinylglutamate desuccinylase/aspartoacylase family protein [Aliiglaciecola sp. 3_MG-2023]|uniref:succinylglutamate desuccinylase/aspartoacylase domain-containing protein n=1 Tax=Aliiglaciecola sp. 3_MG-2023 TaxID=3062644 RepID=UPI0026E1B5C7|nr:succinylglutamate desuccinylase/aspartoacylase family protein [Aliiglaciecola sp. 3_MG-2023]MDO6692019.1 succinylglutamate desuccinylase/aspartoacylase family protein [Aliiglaciecola sp. 3_MG-2023]
MNQFSKEYLVVAQNASGRNMNVPLYRFKGNQPGPKVYVQSSIHGAEVQGNVVIYHLIQTLKSLDICGEITLVPNCNPVGTNIKAGEYTLGRFDPINGTNWNRGYYYDQVLVTEFVDTVDEGESIGSIKSRFRQAIKQKIDEKLTDTWGLGLAQQLNLKLQQLAFDADIVIDLHNGPVSTRHIYVPEYAKASAALFNIPHVILIPNKFAGALDEATFCHWWSLQDLLTEKRTSPIQFDVEAFTLEMGSQEVISFEEGLYDAQSILSYLNAKGCLVDAQYTPKNMQRVAVTLNNYKILYTHQGGMVEYLAKPGLEVKKGQPLAKVLNVDELENERGTETICAPCDLIPILHFPSASVLSGTQLYKCFTQYDRLT